MIRALSVAAFLLVPATAAAQYAVPTAPAQQPVRNGITFEANLGFGFLQAESDGSSSDTESSLGGLNLGIGAFISPRMAISARVAGVTHTEDGASITEAFFGPSVQYWVSPNLWVGGGLGLGVARVEVDGFGSDSETGLALDGRVGYTFNPQAKHSFNVSAELTPAFIEDVTFTGFALLIGYQYQ